MAEFDKLVTVRLEATKPTTKLPCMTVGCDELVSVEVEFTALGSYSVPDGRPYFCDLCRSGVTTYG